MQRRKFILQGGLLSAGVLAGNSALWSANKKGSPNDLINVGVIGTGDRGSGMIPLMNQIKGLNVAACCDVLPFRLEDGLSKAGIQAKPYQNYQQLLDNKDIDAVLVSTPFNTHSQIAKDAVDAGKHVYCEKTLAKGLSDIESLIEKVN